MHAVILVPYVLLEYIAGDEAMQSAIFATRLSSRAVAMLSCKQSGSVLSVLLYFTLITFPE